MPESSQVKKVFWQDTLVTPNARAQLMQQKPVCIWLTGLSGAGKTTIANALEAFLHQNAVRTMLLDGDNIRQGLCSDLGFSEEDRTENLRRVAYVAHLLVQAGLVVIAAFISPRKIHRDFARSLFVDGQFIEVYVDAPIDVCFQRDTKGLYQLADAGHLQNMTAIDQIYEKPENPEFHLETNFFTIDQCLDKMKWILKEIKS